MLIYFLLFLLLICFSFTEQYFKGSKFPEFRIFIFFIFLLFVTFRPVGGDKDYVSYLLSFDSFRDPLDYFRHYNEWVYFDPMYYLIPSFYKTYVSQTNYALMVFFTYALIALSLKVFSVGKLTNLFFLTLLVYFSNYFLLHEMTQIRVGVASAIFLFSIPYLVNKKYVSYVGMVMLAMLFHYSALLYFIPLFFSPFHFKQKIYFLALGVILVLTFVPTDFILPLLKINMGDVQVKSNNYIEYAELGVTEEVNKLNVNFLISYAITVVFTFFINTIQSKNNYAYLLIKLQILGLFLFQIFSPIPGFAFRSSELFMVTQIISIPFFVHIFKNKWLGYGIVILISAIFLGLNLFYGKIMQDYFKV
jgi:hypothetical protein